MAGSMALDSKITTIIPQARRAGRSAPARGRARKVPSDAVVRGDTREGTLGSGRVVVEVMPPNASLGPGVGGGWVRRGGRKLARGSCRDEVWN